jgi:uncharacterized protein (DUF1015 family)
VRRWRGAVCVRSAGVSTSADGLALFPFHALRPHVDAERLGTLLCPPYDVIDPSARTALLAADPDNAVSVILPETADGSDPYLAAAARIEAWVRSGLWSVDGAPAIYVYEMAAADGSVTRGLVGAVELRDPADGVILPHENTMAGPVADRLGLMSATEANLEPIYLVYDGGGFASELVRRVDAEAPVASTVTPDGTTHRLWAVTSPDDHERVLDDLGERKALIADGHHRYATYRQMQQDLGATRGPGPWDRGLTLLVDTSEYGPQVHAIHRVVAGLSLADALAPFGETTDVESPEAGLAAATGVAGFAAVLSDGTRHVLVQDRTGDFAELARTPDQPASLAELDVTVLHRVVVERLWGLPDTVDVVGYAHSVEEALAARERSGGVAVLLRPTPVAAVAAVAAEGGRMPRKSTLFTPKPASGMLMRRFVDET